MAQLCRTENEGSNMQQFLFDYTCGVLLALLSIFVHCSLAMKDRIFITTLMSNLSTEEGYLKALNDKSSSQGAAVHAMLTANTLHTGMVAGIMFMLILCTLQLVFQANWMFLFHVMYWRFFVVYSQALSRTSTSISSLGLTKAHVREIQRRALNGCFHLFRDQRK